MKNLLQVVSDRLKEIMEERGLNQYQLYKLTGIPQPTLSMIMKAPDDRKDIYFSTIYEICSGLEIEFMDFFNSECVKIENIKD